MAWKADISLENQAGRRQIEQERLVMVERIELIMDIDTARQDS